MAVRLNWLNKVLGVALPDVEANKKLTFGEINELRDAVNSHADNIEDLEGHPSRSDNPHNVNATQVGLGNVNNTADADKPVSTAQQEALDAKVAITDIVNELTSNLVNKPLSAAQGKVLKDAIDLINQSLLSDNSNLDTLQEVVDFIEINKDSLDNLSIASIAGLQAALDGKATQASHDNHLADTDNPHGVTKSQVGLANVDNTADLAKPISTAQQAAFDAKLDKSANVQALVSLTQAAYDALTPDANTLYFITE